MIQLFGDARYDWRECRAAEELARLVAASSWYVEVEHDIRIVVGFLSRGGRRREVDLFAICDFGGAPIPVSCAGQTRWILNACMAVEVKDHSDGVEVHPNGSVSVLYDGKPANVVRQSGAQWRGPKNDFRNAGLGEVFIVNLVWLRNYPSSGLTGALPGVLGRDACWADFVLSTVSEERWKPWAIHLGMPAYTAAASVAALADYVSGGTAPLGAAGARTEGAGRPRLDVPPLPHSAHSAHPAPPPPPPLPHHSASPLAPVVGALIDEVTRLGREMDDLESRLRPPPPQRYLPPAAPSPKSRRGRLLLVPVLLALLLVAALVVPRWITRAPGPAAAGAERGRAVVTARGLKLRASPSTGAAVLRVASRGDTVAVLGAAEGGWVPVRYGGSRGFMGERHLASVQPGATAHPASTPGPAHRAPSGERERSGRPRGYEIDAALAAPGLGRTLLLAQFEAGTDSPAAHCRAGAVEALLAEVRSQRLRGSSEEISHEEPCAGHAVVIERTRDLVRLVQRDADRQVVFRHEVPATFVLAAAGR